MPINFLPADIDQYIHTHTRSETDALQYINRDTNAHVMMPRMLSGHLQGQVLRMLCLMIKPRNVLEIGTYTGYSAVCFAEGLQDGGKVVTIDINEELERRTRDNFERSGMASRIDYRIGDAREIIPSLDMSFDLVFIDADKINYKAYYDLCWSKVPVGGWILADNVLWSGRVLFDKAGMDEDTAAINDFNAFVQQDPRVENVLFPVRDGIMVMRKIAE